MVNNRWKPVSDPVYGKLSSLSRVGPEMTVTNLCLKRL